MDEGHESHESHPVDSEIDSGSFLDVENSSYVTEEGSHVTTATAEQIMELLDQLDLTSSLVERGRSSGEVVVQCRQCTGELVVV